MRTVARFLAGMFLAALLGAGWGGDCAAAGGGTVAGTLPMPREVKSVVALDRTNNKQFAGTIDRDTGKFTVAKLPTGGAYDLIVDMDDGSRLEGLDMAVPPSEYVDELPLTEEDTKTIHDKALASNKFENIVEVLAIYGNEQHAVVLMNKLRTTPFYESKPGEIVWRAELWRFERPEDTRAKVQDGSWGLLYRERLQQKAYDRKAITFDPRLGGLRPTDEEPAIDLGGIEPPDRKPGIRIRDGESHTPRVGGN